MNPPLVSVIVTTRNNHETLDACLCSIAKQTYENIELRIGAQTKIARASEFIRHNEGRLYFGKTARKMYYYAQHAGQYFAKNPTKSALTDQSGPIERYKLFFSRPGKLFRNPILGIGMLILKSTEYISGGFGYLSAKMNRAEREQA